MRSHRPGSLLTAASLAVALGACSPGDPDPASTARPGSTPPAPPPAHPTPDSPAETAGRDATVAYLGMWRDVAAAASTSDWRSSRLGEHASGSALSVLSRQLYADHYNDLVTHGHPVLDPAVTSVRPPQDPTTVMIRDCADDRHWLKYHADGTPADDQPGGHYVIHAEVTRGDGGSWRVARFAVEGTATC